MQSIIWNKISNINPYRSYFISNMKHENVRKKYDYWCKTKNFKNSGTKTSSYEWEQGDFS